MDRRDLLKVSPLALMGVVGQVALGEGRGVEGAKAFFDVRAFGAVGDGKTVDSPAVNRAIEAVAAAGGGTLVFPAGEYVCFTIRLKSGVEIFLSRGCRVIAADSPQVGETTGYRGGVYDAAESKTAWDAYQDYGHNHWRNSLFWGEGWMGCRLLGRG